jgi:cell division protein FtsB
MPKPEEPKSGARSTPPKRTPDSADIPAFLRPVAPSAKSAAPKPGERVAGNEGTRAEDPPGVQSPTPPASGAAPPPPSIDPAALPMPALTRRRVGAIGGLIAVAWLVLAFGRQVGAATAAADRAEELRAANAALRANVERLQQDLARVQDDDFVRLQGRGVGLGGAGEIPFTLAANAPTLPPDAPGSASVRLGATPDQRAPLDVWLSMLLGPGR